MPYARIRAGDLECPACHRLLQYGPGRTSYRGKWDKATSCLRCPGCEAVYILATLVYRVNRGAGRLTRPRDQVADPTWVHQARLVAEPLRRYRAEQSNQVRDLATEVVLECTCPARPVDDDCPLHGLDAVLARLDEEQK